MPPYFHDRLQVLPSFLLLLILLHPHLLLLILIYRRRYLRGDPILDRHLSLCTLDVIVILVTRELLIFCFDLRAHRIPWALALEQGRQHGLAGDTHSLPGGALAQAELLLAQVDSEEESAEGLKGIRDWKVHIVKEGKEGGDKSTLFFFKDRNGVETLKGDDDCDRNMFDDDYGKVDAWLVKEGGDLQPCVKPVFFVTIKQEAETSKQDIEKNRVNNEFLDRR